jgi:oligoendopeptidase F
MIKDPRFAEFDRYLRELLRQKRHVLSPAEEALLARTSLMHDSGHNAYATFSAADLRFPSIRRGKGKPLELTQSLFSRYRASPRRKLRRAAFDTFFGTYAGYRNTLAALLSAQVNANLVQAQARRYRDALEAALDPDDIPVSVYHSLIKAANKHLPKLHRYLELRRRLLGLKRLRYYDLYVPMVEAVRFKIPYEKGCRLLLEAMAPMGPAYVEALAHGLAPESGWVDPFPNAGKRSGAYMEGSAYDVHPYVLGNYLDDYNSLSMIAHEMGHAIHSHLSNAHQPYPKADYSIFVAEVASTLNEALLAEDLGRRLQGKKRRFLLGEQLESFRQTFFRQALFAEFELEIYRIAQRNEALTADRLTETYLGIARRYYGHDQGVVEIDDAYGVEWAYIPHFYFNFYVFQYATGITAATALCQMITADSGTGARQRYIDNLLKAGCARSPITILKRAGVDLDTAKPYDLAMSAFDRTIDRLERASA